MGREARWQTSWPCVALASSLVLISSGCSTRGIQKADIPPCPGVVMQEAMAASPECLSDEALNALAGHCLALKELRR